MDSTALQCPLQVTQTQWTIPVQRTVIHLLKFSMLVLSRYYQSIKTYWYIKDHSTPQLSVSTLTFTLQGHGMVYVSIQNNTVQECYI